MLAEKGSLASVCAAPTRQPSLAHSQQQLSGSLSQAWVLAGLHTARLSGLITAGVLSSGERARPSSVPGAALWLLSCLSPHQKSTLYLLGVSGPELQLPAIVLCVQSSEPGLA